MAALLGILILRHFAKQGSDSSINEEGFIRVYSYGTPSCVDAALADNPQILALCTSVVLHDDVVPRLTPTSVRGLLKHLLHVRETWVKTHLSDDLNAITERAYHVWPTRLRESFTLLKKKGVASAKRLKKTCKKQMTGNDENSSITYAYDKTSDTAQTSDDGVDVGGDLFFDPLDEPLNESDDESSIRAQQNASNNMRDKGWAPFDEPPMEVTDDATPSTNIQDTHIDEKQKLNMDDDASPQMLEELPLPRMFIPGKIIHIYTHRGGYKAAFVPRKFRSLRRISMAGNMLGDHMSKSYYEGLLEVKAIRAAKEDLPAWVGFAEDSTCSCCASLFTWASTSNSEAQAARDKHNCRVCGNLVCDPCSKKRIPIPAIGITTPVRVCDRCYNGWCSLYGDSDFDDIVLKSEGDKLLTGLKNMNSRRSVVVDELAQKINSIM